MRTIITLGKKHGSEKLEALQVSNSGEEVARALADFKLACASDVNKMYSVLELWTSDGGRRKQRRFISPAEAEAKAKAKAKAEAADAEAKAKAKVKAEVKN